MRTTFNAEQQMIQKKLTNQKKYTAVIGKSGSGKSTVICSVLKFLGLPTSAEVVSARSIANQCWSGVCLKVPIFRWMHLTCHWFCSYRACASVITEVCYHNESTFKAVVKFVSRAEWKKVCLILVIALMKLYAKGLYRYYYSSTLTCTPNIILLFVPC